MKLYKTYEEYIANLCKDFDNFIPTKEQYEKWLMTNEKRHQECIIRQQIALQKQIKYNEAEAGCYNCIFFHKRDHFNDQDEDRCLRGEKDRAYCRLNPYKLDS